MFHTQYTPDFFEADQYGLRNTVPAELEFSDLILQMFEFMTFLLTVASLYWIYPLI
jgi:hypothetical protein